MSDRTNITDREQSVLEEATFEGGIPVQVDATQRVVAKGAQTSAERTANDGAVTNTKRAGVVMPHSDTPGRFTENLIGKA